MSVGDAQRVRSMLGDKHGVAQALEKFAQDTPQTGFVFSEQNRFVAARHFLHWHFRKGSCGWRFQGRQVNLERRTLPWLAVNIERSSTLFHNSMNGSKA